MNDTFGLGTFGDVALPDPVANYHGGRAQADILFNPNASALEHFGAFLGVAGFTAQAIVEWIPGEATIEKSIEKVAVKLGEEEGVKGLEKVAVKGVEKKVEKVAAAGEKDAAKGATQDVATPEKGGKGGETAATAKGRKMHKEYEPGEGYEKEVTLPSGKRADAVNVETKQVKELKPDNPNAVKRGEKQVEAYRKELQEKHGGEWKGTVETYQ